MRLSSSAGDHGHGDQRRLAVTMVLTGIASVQFGSALATTLFAELGPAGTVFLRTLFAALILLAFRRPARALIGRRAGLEIGLLAISLAMMNLCFYEALDRMPLGIAVTLEFTGPLAVAALTSRGRADLLWALLAAIGVLLFAPDIGDGLDPLGVAFAFAAGAMWAAYIMFAARVGRGPAGSSGLTASMVLAAGILVPFGVTGGGAELLDPALALVALGVALLSSAIPYTLELEALRRLPEKTFGVLLSAEPAVAALVGALVLGQELAGRELIAILLVVVASAGALRRAPEQEPQP